MVQDNGSGNTREYNFDLLDEIAALSHLAVLNVLSGIRCLALSSIKSKFADISVGAIFKSLTDYHKPIRDLKIAPTRFRKLHLAQFMIFQVGQAHYIQTFLMAGF